MRGVRGIGPVVLLLAVERQQGAPFCGQEQSAAPLPPLPPAKSGASSPPGDGGVRLGPPVSMATRLFGDFGAGETKAAREKTKRDHTVDVSSVSTTIWVPRSSDKSSDR